MRNQQVLRLIQSRDCLFARHAGKVFQKLAERMPAFEIVDERLKRDTRSDENRRASENLGIGVNDWIGHDLQNRVTSETDPTL